MFNWGGRGWNHTDVYSTSHPEELDELDDEDDDRAAPSVPKLPNGA